MSRCKYSIAKIVKLRKKKNIKPVYAFTHLFTTFPAIGQLNSASAFVEIVSQRHSIFYTPVKKIK